MSMKGKLSYRTYDARGNEGGGISCTITGDHQNRVTDYTAIVLESEMEEGIGKENARTQNQILRLLQETYGEKEVIEWGVAIMVALQQAKVLQSGVHESCLQGKAENRDELEISSLPSASVVAEWLLRDMRKQQECGCSPQRRKSAEQQPDEFAEVMSELSSESAQASRTLFNMWENGKGIWLLREALSEIQKIRESFYGKGQSAHARSVVRRLTCLECERLQGYPDNWTNIGEWEDSNGKKHKMADSPRYKALGNSIALPFWQWMAERMVKELIEAGVENPTMASLFDGISGFCLVFKRAGCEPKWSSEIEPFPVAVCKKHFGDEEIGEEGDINEYL